MFEKSIVKYPERGPWGRSSWRGNTTGHIVNDFLDFCEIKMQKKIETCSDYMVGSGTTKELCEQRGITGTYWDLSMGKNLLDKDLEIPDRPESIFFHPPYSSHIGIPYAGTEWCAEKIWKKENGKNKCTIIDHTDQYIEKYGFDPKPYDLGRMDWENFIKALNYCILKMYAALETGGRMGILMGDCRRNGKYYSMILDCAKPGEVESIVIKEQSNEQSQGRVYTNQNFIPISQEYFLILKKALPYMLDFSYTKHTKLDIRNSSDSTWKDVVASVFEYYHKKELPLEVIYNAVDGHEKTIRNIHWKEKIRQTLQIYPMFISKGSGRWAVVY